MSADAWTTLAVVGGAPALLVGTRKAPDAILAGAVANSLALGLPARAQ